MKYLIFIVVLVVVGCGSANQGDDVLPDDLVALRQMLDAKNAEVRALQSSIGKIEAKMDELNPNKVIPRRLVTVTGVEPTDFKRFARVQASVQSDAIATVSSEMGGRLTSIVVDEGDYIRRGQLVATIDTISLVKNRQELETQLELAKDIYARQKRLWDQNIGSEVQFLQAKNSVERLEKSIETLEYNLTKSWVYAPISGVVDDVNLKTGQLAQPGLPIVTLLDVNNIKVVADVPETYLGKVARGEEVEIYFPALNDTIISRVTMIGRKIDPSNRTFIIEVLLSGKGQEYKPNLLAEVLINDYVEADVLVVSQELIQEEVGGKKFVVLAKESDEGMIAQKTYITTGESYEGDVVVSSGLEQGDVLVVDGARGLGDADLITIQNSTTQPTSDDE